MLLTALFKKLCPGESHYRKTERMMKILSFLLFLVCLQASVHSSAQEISLSLNNVVLPVALKAIAHQTSYKFIYNDDQLLAASKVTIKVHNASLENVLEICFKDQPLTYVREEKFIIIRPREKDGTALLLDENDVKGIVWNSRGEPIAGATVAIKGTNHATATNDKGFFTLTGVPPGFFVRITSVGYEAREILIGTNRNLNIHLQAAIDGLDEMVIKGYYSTTKRLNTGSVSKINAEDISQQPVSNVLSAMEGRMPGVFIAQSSGVAGAAISLQIRGRNSIRSGNDPLYLVDGVPYTSTQLGSSQSAIIEGGSPLSNINPSDIESVEVLKDADATAIYGSRGANGVILITTKKAVSGKTIVDVNLSEGFGRVDRKMKLLNTAQYLSMRHEAFANDNATIQPTDYDVNGTWDTTRYADWQKELIGGTAHITNAQLSISGGNASTQFLMGGNYRREGTVFPGDFADKRTSVHISLGNTSLDQKFHIMFTASYTNDVNKLLLQDPTYSAVMLAPDAPSPIVNNKLNWDNYDDNPYASLDRPYQLKTSTLMGNILATYQIVHSLAVKVSAGYTDISAREITMFPLASFNPAWGVPSGTSIFGNSSANTWIIEPQLEYKRNVGKGKLALQLGSTFQEEVKKAQLLNATGYLDDALLGNIAAASSITPETSSPDNNYSRLYHYQALFARATYNYQDKYIINLTGRRDGSSRFGPGKQFANFGAAGIAWLFSQEEIFKKQFSFLSFGKIRGSYGSTGNDQIPDYGYLSTYTNSPYPYNGSPGLYPTSLFNTNYGWEINKKLGIGLELAFISNRIFFSLDYYNNRSGNQLIGLPLAAITGFTSIQANLPAVVSNKGWEFSIQTTNLKTSQFSWNSSFNLTIATNKLVSYPNINSSPFANTYAIGQPLSILFKYQQTGVDPATGIYSFTDVDKNGTINFPNDAQFLKSIKPSYYGGLLNSFHWGKLDAQILLQFVKQTGYDYKQSFNPAGFFNTNQPVIILDRWQKVGDVTGVQKFSQDYGGDAYQAYDINRTTGDGNIGDASFVRVKNMSLSYALPVSKMKRVHINQCKFYLQAQNLFTFTNYKGLDPETQTSIALPPLKVLAIGLQLNF